MHQLQVHGALAFYARCARCACCTSRARRACHARYALQACLAPSHSSLQACLAPHHPRRACADSSLHRGFCCWLRGRLRRRFRGCKCCCCCKLLLPRKLPIGLYRPVRPVRPVRPIRPVRPVRPIRQTVCRYRLHTERRRLWLRGSPWYRCIVERKDVRRVVRGIRR
jgi:hypothetical protein